MRLYWVDFLQTRCEYIPVRSEAASMPLTVCKRARRAVPLQPKAAYKLNEIFVEKIARTINLLPTQVSTQNVETDRRSREYCL